MNMSYRHKFAARILVFCLIFAQLFCFEQPMKAEAASTKTGYVNFTYLNLRSQATTKSSIIVKLSKNDPVVIVKTVNSSWYQVTATHGGKKYDGYAASRYITLNKSGSSSSGGSKSGSSTSGSSSSGSSSAASSGQKTGYVNFTYLNLRSQATTKSNIIVKLSKNDPVVIVKTVNSSWYQVTATHSGKKYDGYAASRYITLNKTANAGSSSSGSSSSGSSKSASVSGSSGKSNGKIIYLTFDDGPGKYTKQLLDILDKYNVKATFFVTNQFPKYQNMIAEEAKRGHTVAIHTYSHEWKDCYSSVNSYFNDLEKMQKIVVAQTGKKAALIRFPGGSSNSVSRNYCKGIMTTLTTEVGKRGYVYTDWDVASGDAGDTTSTAQIIKNIENGCKNRTQTVVLQHDIKSYSVNAVEEVIKWGLANGYTFKAMSSSGYTVHAKKLNN